MIGDANDASVFVFRKHLFTKFNANPNQAKRTTPLLRRLQLLKIHTSKHEVLRYRLTVHTVKIPARESLVCDIPAGDGKIVNLFLQCGMVIGHHHIHPLSRNGGERAYLAIH